MTTPLQPENIPAEMRARRRWCWHRLETKESSKPCPACGATHPAKVPRHPGGTGVSSTNPSEWCDFATVSHIPNGLHGISYVLAEQDGLVCIDLDGIRDPKTGAVKPEAQTIIDRLDSYTEVSASGCGVHVFVRAKLPGGKGVHPAGSWVEMYADKKIIAMTGDVCGLQCDLQDRDIQWLYDRVVAGEFAPAAPVKAKSTGDQSADDYRLACKLAEQFGGDPAKVKPAFLRQAVQRDKLKRADYVDATVSKACATILTSSPLKQSTSAPIQKTDEPDKTWRTVFHTGAELDPTPAKVFIKGILEEGVAAFGALSGVGKTWIGLSISHALITGEPLFGTFPVITRSPVLYLVPEMGTGKFRERMVKMRIPMDGMFFCQTLADGACNLSDPLLIQAVVMMRPTVILDTAIRFNVTDDENQALNNANGLATALFNLRKHGAPLIIAMHHRSKATRGEPLTLENTLRGTGDFGAMCDTVWGVEHDCKKTKNGAINNEEYFDESQNLTRLHLKCVKPRDMEPADPFRIQGRPHIDERGDFRVLAAIGDADEPPISGSSDNEKLDGIFRQTPKASIREVQRHMGWSYDKAVARVKARGWVSVDGNWQREVVGAPELGF